jgi:FKBP-type peptidyl-prolyl cis-trans isomerase
MSVANFYMSSGVKQLNTEIVTKAMQAALAKKKLLMTDDQAMKTIMRLINPAQLQAEEQAQAKAQANKVAGENFLTQNRSKTGVKTTASGLQYEVLVQGNGERPNATDTVEVNYLGKLIDGTEFDNSYKRGSSISFPLNGVIRGWTEALQLMPVGSKYRLYIPAQLGYGNHDQGPIPGGSVLIFDVELLKIKRAAR